MENEKGDDATGTDDEPPQLIDTFTATDPEDITTANPDRAMTWTT